MVSIPTTGGRKVTVLLYCRFHVPPLQLPHMFISITLLCSTTVTCTVFNSTLQNIFNPTIAIITTARYTTINSAIVITINFLISLSPLVTAICLNKTC